MQPRGTSGKYFDSFMHELWAHETPICFRGVLHAVCAAWFPCCDDLVIFWPQIPLVFTWCCNISLRFWFPFIGEKHLLLMILWPFDFELFPIFPQKVKQEGNKCPLRRLDQLYGKVGGALWALLEEVFLLQHLTNIKPAEFTWQIQAKTTVGGKSSKTLSVVSLYKRCAWQKGFCFDTKLSFFASAAD